MARARETGDVADAAEDAGGEHGSEAVEIGQTGGAGLDAGSDLFVEDLELVVETAKIGQEVESHGASGLGYELAWSHGA